MQSDSIKTYDALPHILLRNEFYRRKYYWLLGVFFLGIVVIALLGWMLTYLVKHPTHPLYFVTDSVGRLIREIPPQQPNMTTADVSAWAVAAVESAYSYDFINFRSQMQDAQKYFTDYGWRNYMKGLDASNNLVALKQRKMIVVAKVIGTPKLSAEGPLGKERIYAWKFEMPLLITYSLPPYNEKSDFQNPHVITVIIQRQDALSSYKGLGIVQMVDNLAGAAPAGLGATT
ncbi:MAG: DotI/IcmL/TraM family protein [Gammaproteobacteria bacterium]|nr:DotI/IcmL/TraM family protein [Gammaproteobacteria bacterium]